MLRKITWQEASRRMFQEEGQAASQAGRKAQDLPSKCSSSGQLAEPIPEKRAVRGKEQEAGQSRGCECRFLLGKS